MIPFLDLPEDIIQQILPEIELHRDLVNFACTSRLCSKLVIPQHTEYRVLRLGTTTSFHVWAHLARRPDLASNIREVDIEGLAASYPLEPSSLIEDVDREERTIEAEDEEMRLALGQMKRLKSFCWDQDEIYDAPVVFDALQQLDCVEHLCLDICKPFDFNEPLEECGLWKIAQLRSLLITGHYDDWPSTARSNAKVFSNWLNSLTSLELLCLSPQILEDHHTYLLFPNLRRLKVPAWHVGLEDVVLNFLGRHPGVKELSWDSYLPFSASARIPAQFLPNLRYLDGPYDFFLALVSQSEADLLPPRKLEKLSLSCPDDDYIDTFCACPGIDHHTLRILSLGGLQTSRDIQKLAAAYPMIQELSLPQLTIGHVFSFEEILLGLEQLKHLKMLYRDAIWGDLEIQKGGSDLDLQDSKLQMIVDERIQTLGRQCPNLVQISHPKVYDRFIRICRDDGEVTTRVKSALPSSRFEMRYDGF